MAHLAQAIIQPLNDEQTWIETSNFGV